MSGKKGEETKIKDNLKANLKKFIHDTDISLESVGSDSEISGEFIEVEFHKNQWWIFRQIIENLFIHYFINSTHNSIPF